MEKMLEQDEWNRKETGTGFKAKLMDNFVC